MGYEINQLSFYGKLIISQNSQTVKEISPSVLLVADAFVDDAKFFDSFFIQTIHAVDDYFDFVSFEDLRFYLFEFRVTGGNDQCF